MVYSVRAARQFDGSFSELAEPLSRKSEDWRDGGDICASSNQSAGLRSLPQAGNTLSRSPIFANLSDQDIAWLNTRCLWRRIRAGEFLPNESTDGSALSIVTNGRVRAVRMLNGREIILRDIEEGEYFGELSAIDGRPGRSQIVAITDAIVARMPSKIFRETLHRSPLFCDQVLMNLAEQIRSMNDRFSEQISLTARERLCVELLRLSRRTANDRIAVSPPPSHAELAARIGGLRETVTKLLIALERDGVISRSRSAIALVDVPRLRMIASPQNGEA
jgi:CRP/FNR family transcriptional regulator, cyclic AMP receptor protein